MGARATVSAMYIEHLYAFSVFAQWSILCVESDTGMLSDTKMEEEGRSATQDCGRGAWGGDSHQFGIFLIKDTEFF